MTGARTTEVQAALDAGIAYLARVIEHQKTQGKRGERYLANATRMRAERVAAKAGKVLPDDE